MAKKQENEFSYGSAFLPKPKYEKKYPIVEWGWNGLNEKDDIDTGQLTAMNGMVCEPPYMTPAKKPKVWLDLKNGIPVNATTVGAASRQQGSVVNIAGVDNQLILVWQQTYYSPGNPDLYTIKVSRFLQGTDDIHINQSSFSSTASTSSTQTQRRSVVQFNAVDTSSGNIVEYTYDRKLLVYPDCYSIPYAFNNTAYDIAPSLFNVPDTNPIPVSNYATVYNSRVFGVNDNATFASDYNSYAAYNLDTADDTSSANAWWSLTNSNTDADGAFTAICTYDNHVVLFRKDFMQLVYNNKNPFRVVDVGAFGCTSDKAWTIMNGVLYFASDEKVYAYTGGTPKEISKKLDVDTFRNAILGSYKDTLWLEISGDTYTYKDGVWSKTEYGGNSEPPFQIIQFAQLDWALVALAWYQATGSTPAHYKLILMDWDMDFLKPFSPPGDWSPDYSGSWWFDTDIMALGKLDVRRVKKFTVLCEGEENAYMAVYLIKDGRNPFSYEAQIKIGEITFDGDLDHRMKMLRIMTRQFSSTMHQLRFYGHGYVKIYAAEIKISWGGELYVEQ